ncbi:MAG TPA: CehA/McbA family metallohydrolase [Candidatus Ruania gallistercoris]|uniref:CehA/McbA family metallohydrolase n=1 Tax=Candidatus Ruania gallistercoris TaxID=2838746 RepID=A0A9D2J3Z0_9MICO|nr:CehA/McbA family metallohydrolase [Candidatus Ruania gallistercoris]
MTPARLDRLLTVDDQIRDRYLRVPFEVPPGAPGVEVQLTVADPAAVIDLGCEAPSRWCGWAGGARKSFVVRPEEATPGFLPGVEPGTWHLVLGLHQLPVQGVQVQVEVATDSTAEVAAEPLAPLAPAVRGSSRAVPAGAGLTWYAGDFHAHTVHSDGQESIDQLAARAVASGLDFLAVTDHNTISHHRLLGASAARHQVTLLPGQELTTARGHGVAYGDIGWVDFRRPAQHWLAEIERRGGLLAVSHPAEGDCAWQHQLDRAPHALELWHISWFRDLTATAPWAFWQLLEHLPGSARTALIGGSDFHAPGAGWTLGTPTTWVAAAECTPEAILAGVAAGRTAISLGVRPDATPDPLGTPLLLRHDGDLLALAGSGAVLVDALGRRRRILADEVRVSGDWGRGPYHLEDPVRRVLAICR